MIAGIHAVVFASDAEKARAFFRDVLELESVDAGGGCATPRRSSSPGRPRARAAWR